MIETVNKQVASSVATCDRCGVRTRPHYKCAGCGIHLCRGACTTYLDTDPWTGTLNGDYPDRVCKSCLELLKPFAAEAQRTIDEAFEKTAELQRQWLASCKAGGGQ